MENAGVHPSLWQAMRGVNEENYRTPKSCKSNRGCNLERPATQTNVSSSYYSQPSRNAAITIRASAIR